MPNKLLQPLASITEDSEHCRCAYRRVMAYALVAVVGVTVIVSHPVVAQSADKPVSVSEPPSDASPAGQDNAALSSTSAAETDSQRSNPVQSPLPLPVDGAETTGSDQPVNGTVTDNYEPSERISEDSSVSFPVDI